LRPQSVADFLWETDLDRASIEWVDPRLSRLMVAEHKETLVTRH
jgi:hypothetical protein